LIKSRALQAKLRIGQPNDIYEQEADRVAEQVMRMPGPVVQRKCTRCNEDEKNILQAKESTGQVPVTPSHNMPSITLPAINLTWDSLAQLGLFQPTPQFQFTFPSRGASSLTSPIQPPFLLPSPTLGQPP
jgi:hypothetical protein